MSIKEWYDRGCNYQEGVALYSQLKGHSVNLLRLFYRKESKLNLDKLKYELSKFSDSTISDIPTAAPSSVIKSSPTNTSVDKKKPDTNHFYRLNQLHPDLHELSIKQRNDFQLAVAAHSKLVLLHPDEESAALQLSLYIESLFDSIEAIQKVLDYYVKNKIVIDITPRTYADFTPEQRVIAQRNKRISVNKYQKKVAAFKNKLNTDLSLSDKTKTEVSLERAESKLLKHEMELQELNELINRK
jgi:hypothetical protein